MNSAQFGNDIGGYALRVVIDEQATAVMKRRRLNDDGSTSDD